MTPAELETIVQEFKATADKVGGKLYISGDKTSIQLRIKDISKSDLRELAEDTIVLRDHAFPDSNQSITMGVYVYKDRVDIMIFVYIYDEIETVSQPDPLAELIYQLKDVYGSKDD